MAPSSSIEPNTTSPKTREESKKREALLTTPDPKDNKECSSSSDAFCPVVWLAREFIDGRMVVTINTTTRRKSDF